MIGSVLAGAAKGLMKKPKKINPDKFAGKMEETKESSESKGGALALAPSESIVKVVDIKPNEPKVNVKSGTLKGGPLAEIQEGVHSIVAALSNESKAKKKRLKAKRKNQEKKKRAFLESLSEIGSVGAKIGGAIASKSGVGSLLSNIWKTIGILFVGWMMNHLPKIIAFIQKFVEIVGKIGKFLEPIVKAVFATMVWITDKGTKLTAMLVGVKPDEALNNSIIKNFTEIQKRLPLIEAIFATFAVLKARSVLSQQFKKPKTTKTKPTKVKPRTKSAKLTQNRRTSQAVRNRFARRFGGNASRARFGGNVPGRLGTRGSSIFGRGFNKGIGRLGLKMFGKGPMKIIAKFAKIPIIGPLIVAVTQLLSGEPLGKALFMGVGAGLGGVLGGLLSGALGIGTAGFGAVLAPAIMIMAEGIGAFVGELLYDGFLGKGWGAAGQKLKDTVAGFFKQTGEIIKSVWKWIMGGGLIELGKSVGKGIVYFLNPAGFWWDMAKKLGGVMKAVGEWIGGAMLRFIDNFFKETAIEIPDGGGIRAGLTLAAQTLGLYDWLEGIGYAGGKDGQIDKFPNLLQLYNPFKYVPLLFKSFFPEKAKAMAEKKAAVERGDVAKKNIFGVELSDEHQSEEYLKKRDSGQITSGDSGQIASDSTSQKTEQNASSISHSASYDRVDVQKGGRGSAIIPVPINQMQGGTSGGSGGGASSSGVNKYDVVSDLKKTMVLAKLYPG